MTTNRDLDSACARVRGRIDELIDGGLASLEAARDEGHLEACEACGAARAGRLGWLAAVQRATSPGPDEFTGALTGLEERLDAARAPRHGGFQLLTGGAARRAGVAAALAASALLALALLQGLGTSGARIGGQLASSLRDLDPNRLPAPTWPDDPTRLLGGR